MIVWVKFLHICAISIWCAGLLSLPGLYVQRAHVTVDAILYRLQALVRFAYVAIISPAAFVAVASGTALIFMQETFDPWFQLKMMFVTLLVVAHVLTGLVIIRLFEDDRVYPTWRFILVTTLIALLVTAILWVVLAKPEVDYFFLPKGWMEPGALGDFLWPIIEPITPDFILSAT
jgi:protoporphyrinogen IX oxidase